MFAGYTLPLALCAGPTRGAIGHPAIVSGYLPTQMLVGTYLLMRTIKNEY